MLTFTNTLQIGCTLSSISFCSGSDIPSHSFTQPSRSLSLLSTSLAQQSLSFVASFSFSSSSADTINSHSTSSNDSFPFVFGMSDCWITLFAMRLMMWSKHRVWFESPGNIYKWDSDDLHYWYSNWRTDSYITHTPPDTGQRRRIRHSWYSGQHWLGSDFPKDIYESYNILDVLWWYVVV